MNRPPLLVAGLLFALVALVHLYRLYSHFSIVVDGTEIPYWVNFAAVFVFGALSAWMFNSANREK